MTAQIEDYVRYRGKRYSLVGINGTGLFDPSEHGLEPVGMSTACWRGFVCTYAVRAEELRLDALEISFQGAAPPLFGVELARKRGEDGFFNGVYRGLDRRMPYTGGILVARDFIEELYVHMGFHPAWKYREAHELVFRDGCLLEAHDRTEEMALERQLRSGAEFEPDSRTPRGDVVEWIKRRFDRNYDT